MRDAPVWFGLAAIAVVLIYILRLACIVWFMHVNAYLDESLSDLTSVTESIKSNDNDNDSMNTPDIRLVSDDDCKDL